MARKLIVTSEGKLRAKYGEAGWKKIAKALDALAKADAARGVETSRASLDGTGKQAGKGKALGASAFKTRIDQAFTKAERPEYLVILGGPDVVPHQPIVNPAGDDDAKVPSDLPYACEAKAANRVDRFVAASRAVGRIPDLPDSDDPGPLMALLDRAAKWKPLTRKDYGQFFGLSTVEWQKSTTLSVQALFGPKAKVRLSPTEGPAWKKADLAGRAHFINCHGAPADPQFYGQSGEAYPVAHFSPRLKGLVKAGTVVAAECCYGAELYDPHDGAAGICSTYLAEGAIGFLGSTTIAYGPSDSNGSADLLCRFFLEEILSGASLGRAMLVARQRFAHTATPLSPIDLKTLAQFHLLGDPSLHPVATPATKAAVRSKGKVALVAPRAPLVGAAAELVPRLEWVDTGALEPTPNHAAAALLAEANLAGLEADGDVRTYAVHRPQGPLAARSPVALLASMATIKKAPSGARFHLLFARPPGAPETNGKQRRGTVAAPGITHKVCLLAREVGGSVDRIERLWARGATKASHGRVRRDGDPEARGGRLEE
jgi:hypothetical protein